MKIKWTAESGFIDALPKIIEEYRLVRGLTPVKILITGPPYSGKTQLAKRLAAKYNISYLEINKVVQNALADLHDLIEAANKKTSVERDEEQEADVDEDEGPNQVQIAEELLLKIEKSREQNDGKIHDKFMVQFMKEKILSVPCQNQGFVLDFFPENYQQAKQLFSNGGAADNEEQEQVNPENEEPFAGDKRVLPGTVQKTA